MICIRKIRFGLIMRIQNIISPGKTPKFHHRYEVFAQLPGGELGRDVRGYGIDGDPGYIAAEVAAVQECYAFAGGEEARDSLRIAVVAELTDGEEGESVRLLPHVGEPFHPVVVFDGHGDFVGLEVVEQHGGQEFEARGAPDGILAHFVVPVSHLGCVVKGVGAWGHRRTCWMR